VPVFFYHFRTRRGVLLVDDAGIAFACREAAIEEARVAAAELGRGCPSASTGGAFEVHDEAGWLVKRVPVR
jgi:hypothetical protein